MKHQKPECPIRDETGQTVIADEALLATDTHAQNQGEAEQQALLPLVLDTDKYREYLQDYELTEQQENELLEALWNILWTFADMGFGLDSVQLFPDVDKDDDLDENAGTDSVNSLEIKEPLNHQSMAEKFCIEAQTVEDIKGGQP